MSSLIKFSVQIDTGKPGSVFKILHTQQSEIIVEFPRKIYLALILPVDLCLEMSSDFNYNFGFVVEEFSSLGIQ